MAEVHSEEAIMEEIAKYAPEYERDVLDQNTQNEYNEPNAREFLQTADRWKALHYLLRFYLHADHLERYGEPAARALERLGQTSELNSEKLCQEFDQTCREQFDYEPLERDRHRLRGAAQLYNEHSNVLHWVRDKIQESGELAPLYDELTDIKWVGRKISTFYLRDAVWVWDVEDEVIEADRQYLHPIDRWVRRVGEYLVSDLEGASSSEVAERLAEKCTTFGISSVEFNQGAFYFGAKKVGDEGQLEARLEELATSA